MPTCQRDGIWSNWKAKIGCKSHSGATAGCQCEERIGEGSLTLYPFPHYSSLRLFIFLSLYLLLTSHN